MKYSHLIKASIFALGLASTATMAVPVQGTLGTSSTGSLDITLQVAPLVLVTNLNDIALGTYSGTGNLSNSDNFCIYHNGDGKFNITMNGSGTGSAYTLANGSNLLPYTVGFTNGAAPIAPMTTLVALTGQTGANLVDSTCSGGDNVKVDITVANASLATAPAGTYTGTLTMVVAPE